MVASEFNGHTGLKAPEETPSRVIGMVSGSAVQKHRKEHWTKDGDLGIMLSMEVVRGGTEEEGEIVQEEMWRRRKETCDQIPRCPDNSGWAEGDELAKELRKSSSRSWMKIREELCYGGRAKTVQEEGPVCQPDRDYKGHPECYWDFPSGAVDKNHLPMQGTGV